MKPIKAFIAFMLLMIVSSAFAQAQADPTYILGPEDVIDVNVRDVPEASRELVIRSDGKITHPIVGEIHVAGLTVKEARDKIYEALTVKEYKKSIEVTVNVKSMRANRIYVMGSVNNSGMVDWKPGWRLTELISAAGGLSGAAEQLTALVWRKGEPARKIKLREVLIEGNEAANIEVKPGDTINIHNKPTIRVTVTGKVVKQGLADVFEGDGAQQAVAAMGGASPDGALSRAKVKRNGEEIPVDLYSVMYLGQLDKDVALQDGDIINVPENKAKVAVVGSVNDPGPVEVPDGRTIRLAEAVGLAGGPIREAKTDSIMLSRRNADGSFTSKAYNYKDILAGKKGVEDPLLQDGDVVFIAQSGKPNTNTIGSILGLILTGGGLFGRLGF